MIAAKTRILWSRGGVDVLEMNLKSVVKSLIFIIGGTLILSFGTAVFIVPFGLVAGGVSGFAIVINRAFGGVMSVDLLIAVLTWSLFTLGIFTLGKDFAFKTLISTVVYPIGTSLFGRLADGSFFDLANSAYPQLAVLLSALFGGVLVGTGCAVTFLGGGSSGGIDVLAFTLCRFFPKLRSPAVIFAIDAVAVFLGMIVLGDAVLSMLGIITALVSALAVDKIFLGGSRAFAAQIISDKCEAINRAVIERLKRTATIIDVVGGYSGMKKKMLCVSFGYTQYSELVRIVSDIDRLAFVTIHRAYRVGGEGWSELK